MPASNQGPLTGRYTIVPRTLIFLTRGEKILLLKGAAHKRLWANLYNGIGGHVERGEDVFSAARRELMEETGLVMNDLWLRGVVTIDTGQETGIGLYVLSGECSSGEPIPTQEGTLEWINRNDLNQLPLVEDLPILLQRVLEIEPSQAPFSAIYRYNHAGKLQISFYKE